MPPVLVTEPPAVVTTTSFTPTESTGVRIEIVVEVFVSILAALPPTVTPVALSKLVPFITEIVPPPVMAEVIVNEETVGAFTAFAGAVGIKIEEAKKSRALIQRPERLRIGMLFTGKS